jgi:hypothetical protein
MHISLSDHPDEPKALAYFAHGVESGAVATLFAHGLARELR